MSSLNKSDKKYISSGQNLKLSDNTKQSDIKKTGETPAFFEQLKFFLRNYLTSRSTSST